MRATAVVPGPDDAAVWTIELSSGDGDGLVGEPFTPLAGTNDVELHRDVLVPGELFPMTSHGTPALVLVTAGGSSSRPRARGRRWRPAPQRRSTAT